MTTAITTIKKWQDAYMTRIARIEEPAVRYTAKASEAVADYIPERPHWAFLDEVPTVTEFVDSQLKFRRRVVDEQAAFVRKLLKAMQPALSKLEPKAAPKQSATRRASTKRPAHRRIESKAA